MARHPLASNKVMLPAKMPIEKLMDQTVPSTSPIIKSSKSVEASAVLARDLWSASLQETIVEVFATMVGTAVTTEPTDVPLATAQLTGIVGIAGAIRANFILQCSHAASIKLSSQMLGILPDDPDSRKASADALGEICNIVAGYFKAKSVWATPACYRCQRSSWDKITSFIRPGCSKSWNSPCRMKGSNFSRRWRLRDERMIVQHEDPAEDQRRPSGVCVGAYLSPLRGFVMFRLLLTAAP